MMIEFFCMKNFILSQDEIQELRYAHKSALKNRDGRLAYKIASYAESVGQFR